MVVTLSSITFYHPWNIKYFFFSVAEESYQAYRSIHFIKDITTIPLNETGPLINLRTSIENARHTNNGTAVPQSILKIYIPVEVVDRGGRRSRPLIVPTEVLTGLENVNCSHYDAIPSGLVSSSSLTIYSYIYLNGGRGGEMFMSYWYRLYKNSCIIYNRVKFVLLCKWSSYLRLLQYI